MCKGWFSTVCGSVFVTLKNTFVVSKKIINQSFSFLKNVWTLQRGCIKERVTSSQTHSGTLRASYGGRPMPGHGQRFHKSPAGWGEQLPGLHPHRPPRPGQRHPQVRIKVKTLMKTYCWISCWIRSVWPLNSECGPDYFTSGIGKRLIQCTMLLVF